MTDLAAVFGPHGSLASRLAERLADLLKVPVHSVSTRPESETRPGVCLAPTAAAVDSAIPVLVFADDSGPLKNARDLEREAAFGLLSRAQASGSRVAIISGKGAMSRWLRGVQEEGLPTPRPVQRVFLAAGPGEDEGHVGEALARALGLPVSHPDDEGDTTVEGWGRRYASAASADRWLVRSASWHAVEYLVPRADAVIHLANAAEPATAPPEKATWRVLFGPWFKRYPHIEASLLARELHAHGHEAPVYTIRNDAELEAVLTGFAAGTPAGAH